MVHIHYAASLYILMPQSTMTPCNHCQCTSQAQVSTWSLKTWHNVQDPHQVLKHFVLHSHACNASEATYTKQNSDNATMYNPAEVWQNNVWIWMQPIPIYFWKFCQGAALTLQQLILVQVLCHASSNAKSKCYCFHSLFVSMSFTFCMDHQHTYTVSFFLNNEVMARSMLAVLCCVHHKL